MKIFNFLVIYTPFFIILQIKTFWCHGTFNKYWLGSFIPACHLIMYREEVRPPGCLLKAGGGQPVQAQQLQPAASALLLHLVRGIATRKVTLQPQSSLMVCSPLRQWCCNQQRTEKSESPICLGIMSLIKYTSLLSQEHFCKVMETQT